MAWIRINVRVLALLVPVMRAVDMTCSVPRGVRAVLVCVCAGVVCRITAVFYIHVTSI